MNSLEDKIIIKWNISSIEALKEIQFMLDINSYPTEVEEELIYCYDSSVNVDGLFPACYVGAHESDGALSLIFGVGDENTTLDNWDSDSFYVGFDENPLNVENHLRMYLKQKEKEFKLNKKEEI